MLEFSFQGSLNNRSQPDKPFQYDFSLSSDLKGVLAFYGASGEGKSTLLRLISGLDRVESGRISLNGECWQDENIFVSPEKRNVGYVFQDGRLFGGLNIEANILYGLGAKENNWRKLTPETKKWVEQVCGQLGIEHWMKRYPNELSGGQKQRVALARSIISRPALLLMDEPFSSLDRQAKTEILPVIEKITSELNVPCILVSHSRYELEFLAKECAVIKQGQVIAHDTTSALLTRLDLPLSHEEQSTSLISTRVESHDENNSLTQLSIGTQSIWVQKNIADLDDELSVRVFARDIVVSVLRPVESSVLNLLTGDIIEIERTSSSKVLIVLEVDGQKMLARITRKSLINLDLKITQAVYIQFKSVSVEGCLSRVD